MIEASLILTRTISIPEVLWTCVSFLAAVYVGKIFFRMVGNLRYLKKMKWNNARESAAWISIVTFGALLFVVTANTVAGLIAMSIPSASSTSIHPLTYLITAVFIAKSIVVASCAYAIDHMQIRLISKIAYLARVAEEQTQEWDGKERRASR